MYNTNPTMVASPNHFQHKQRPLFEMHTLEWLFTNCPEQFNASKRSAFFEIIWIQKGSGTITIDINKHNIIENAVYCINAGQIKCIDPDTAITGYHISFSPEFLYLSQDNTRAGFDTKAYGAGGVAGVIAAGEELQIEMREIMGRMEKESAGQSLMKTEILKGLLRLLINYLTRHAGINCQANITDRNNELVKNFLSLVESSLTKKRMVYDYAKDLNLTPNYLNEIVKKITGYPANYHIQQRKILEAKRQLVHNGISMKEIAYYLGFDDMAHFSKFFKVHSGSGFQEYKKGLSQSLLVH